MIGPAERLRLNIRGVSHQRPALQRRDVQSEVPSGLWNRFLSGKIFRNYYGRSAFRRFSEIFEGSFSGFFDTFPGSSPRVPRKPDENGTFENERAGDKDGGFRDVVFLCEIFPKYFGPLAKSQKMTPKKSEKYPKNIFDVVYNG